MSSRQNFNGRGICLYRVRLCHKLLYVMLSAVWQLPTPLSMLMLMFFKYLAKPVEIRSARLFVDMDRIHAETRATALLHPLGSTEAA